MTCFKLYLGKVIILKVCFNCKKEVEDKAKFCPNCGKYIFNEINNEEEIYCPKCFKIVNDRQISYCPNCGNKLIKNDKNEVINKKDVGNNGVFNKIDYIKSSGNYNSFVYINKALLNKTYLLSFLESISILLLYVLIATIPFTYNGVKNFNFIDLMPLILAHDGGFIVYLIYFMITCLVLFYGIFIIPSFIICLSDFSKPENNYIKDYLNLTNTKLLDKKYKSYSYRKNLITHLIIILVALLIMLGVLIMFKLINKENDFKLNLFYLVILSMYLLSLMLEIIKKIIFNKVKKNLKQQND